MKTEKLYIGEKYFLMVIERFTKTHMLYYQKNDTIAKKFEISVQSASNMISKLVNMGYLKREISDDGKRILTYTGKEYERLQFFPNITKNEQKVDDLKKELKKYKKDCEYYSHMNKQLKEQNEELMKKIEKMQKSS